MFNKPQLHQYPISIQLAKKLNLLLKHWNCGSGGSRPSDNGWGGGGDHPDADIRGGGHKKSVFQPFGPQFGLTIKGRGSQAPPLDTPLCGHVTGRSCVAYSVWGQSSGVL